MLQSLHLVRLPFPFLSPLSPLQPQPISLSSLPKPTSTLLSALPRARTEPFLAQVPDGPQPATGEDGPVELLPSAPSIFATSDEPSQLQVATSVLLTGAISVFLFRSLRRRAKRVKELKFRSSGVKKSIKEEAMESLKAMTPVSPGAKGPPSPVQALLGGISAGVIALILYKFTTTIEGTLSRQAIPDNFSVRQITITIRTIINGLCYLATFVFGINSIGLILYSGQLALSSIMGDSSSEKVIESSQMGSNVTTNSLEDSSKADFSNEDQNPDST